MSSLVAFLIAFPLVMGAVLLFVTRASIRNPLVLVSERGIIVASIATVVTFGNGDGRLLRTSQRHDPGLRAPRRRDRHHRLHRGDQRHKPPLAGSRLMALAQLGIAVYLEVTGRMPEVDAQRLFWFDRLTMVMVLIIGIIGTLICVNALGYMRDYHRASPMIRAAATSSSPCSSSSSPACSGWSSNSLPMMLVFWEITTLCSFLLIGYTRTEETIGYAFKALNMNLLGGLASGPRSRSCQTST
jgi:ech hydrogenase subunit A